MIDIRDRLIADLRDTIERQRLTIRELQAVRSDVSFIPAEWKIPNKQCQILALLCQAPWTTKDEIINALYNGFGHEAPTGNTVESNVSQLRRKIRPHGLDIESRRFLGYRLIDPEGLMPKQMAPSDRRAA